jgi:hypothetical protein
VVGVPAESIILTGDPVCVCPGGNIADAPTNAFGRTTFSGTLAAGGCVPYLVLEVDGMVISTVPVGTNSPDDPLGIPCHVGADERAAMSAVLSGDIYHICLDFNEDGIIDAFDWAALLSRYSGRYGSIGCPPRVQDNIRSWRASERKQK